MGIYGNVFKQECVNDILNYTTEDYLDDFYKNYYAAESYLDSMVFTYNILKEDSTALSNPADFKSARKQYAERDANKLSSKIKAMFQAFIKWVKSMWEKLVQLVKETIKKVQDAHIRDKAMGLAFGKLEWKDVDNAINNGWKGLPYEGTVMVNPAEIKDSEIVRNARFHLKYEDTIEGMEQKINKFIDLFNSNNLEGAKENYTEIKDRCEEILDKHFKVKSPDSISRTRAFERGVGILRDEAGKGFFVYLAKQSSDGKYGYPDESQFNAIKLLAVNGDKYTGDCRDKYYNDHIKELEEFIKHDIASFEKEENKAENFENDVHYQINNLMLKSRLVVDRTMFKAHQNILTEIVGVIKAQIKHATASYTALFVSLKAFNAVGSVTNKTSAKAATAGA